MNSKLKFKKPFYFFIVVGTILLFFLINTTDNVNNFKEELKEIDVKYVSVAGQELKVDVASMDSERVRGLSGKVALEDNQGMLFVFDSSQKYSFWMKDMNFPIDIIWIGEDFRIVYIKKNALPSSYPESFSPDENAKYVLEVNSGFSEKNNLKKGDMVQFLP